MYNDTERLGFQCVTRGPWVITGLLEYNASSQKLAMVWWVVFILIDISIRMTNTLSTFWGEPKWETSTNTMQETCWLPSGILHINCVQLGLQLTVSRGQSPFCQRPRIWKCGAQNSLFFLCLLLVYLTSLPQSRGVVYRIYGLFILYLGCILVSWKTAFDFIGSVSICQEHNP